MYQPLNKEGKSDRLALRFWWLVDSNISFSQFLGASSDFSIDGECEGNRIEQNAPLESVPNGFTSLLNFMGICFSAKEQYQYSQQQETQGKK